jgi:hypothetical protein
MDLQEEKRHNQTKRNEANNERDFIEGQAPSPRLLVAHGGPQQGAEDAAPKPDAVAARLHLALAKEQEERRKTIDDKY